MTMHTNQRQPPPGWNLFLAIVVTAWLFTLPAAVVILLLWCLLG